MKVVIRKRNLSVVDAAEVPYRKFCCYVYNGEGSSLNVWRRGNATVAFTRVKLKVATHYVEAPKALNALKMTYPVSPPEDQVAEKKI